MSPECDNCGAHVSAAFKRALSDKGGVLHTCPEYASLEACVCAGIWSAYQQRTDADGLNTMTDRGEDR